MCKLVVILKMEVSGWISGPAPRTPRVKKACYLIITELFKDPCPRSETTGLDHLGNCAGLPAASLALLSHAMTSQIRI